VFPGVVPVANNTPIKPAYGLRTERISGTSFTAPRAQNLQTFMYRSVSSLDHDDFEPLEGEEASKALDYLSPNSYTWPRFPVDKAADWVSAHKLLARNGSPAAKEGLAIWVWSVCKDMPSRTAFSSIDGESLIVLQAGTLDIQTELGHLLVRQNEIAVIPRGIRYRVSLPTGKPARGYTCELFQGHFRLPELGPVGSTGLANTRDFQIPIAAFDGTLQEQTATPNHRDTEHTIVTRQNGRLWHCKQSHTPFDVAGWHGTLYPYKYDLARFAVMGNLLFDEHDPCLYTVLTAPSHGGEPGNAVVDFAIIPPRWMVAEDTFRLPYYHRNTMCEFYAPIIHAQDPAYPFNGGASFKPFGAGLHGGNVAHGPTERDFLAAREVGDAPDKVQTDGITVFLLETEKPLFVSDLGRELDVQASISARNKKDAAELLVQEEAKKAKGKASSKL
jgi:homogentisate 1,2-dioxygenase